jgi:hypothetical protein
VIDYGGGFAEKNLRRMIQFAQVFPDEQIVVSLPQPPIHEQKALVQYSKNERIQSVNLRNALANSISLLRDRRSALTLLRSQDKSTCMARM